MRINLPNSAHLQNLQGLVRKLDLEDTNLLEFSMNPRWVSVHPVVLAMTACAASVVAANGGTITGEVGHHASLHYLIRMKLFDYVRIDPGKTIEEHEESGRFIPISQIKTTQDLRDAIANLIPLLHAEPEAADSIKYVFSELARNALEHSASPVGAFVCAQYYRKTNRVSIGIADAGIGILDSMKRSHRVHTDREAITLALQPGVTGTTNRIGGTEFNAGAGLFFTKSIARLSRNFFVVYSGNAMFKLLLGPRDAPIALHANPAADYHLFLDNAPSWDGTVVGIDVSIAPGQEFADLLAEIRRAYFGDVKAKKKAYYKKIKFT